MTKEKFNIWVQDMKNQSQMQKWKIFLIKTTTVIGLLATAIQISCLQEESQIEWIFYVFYKLSKYENSAIVVHIVEMMIAPKHLNWEKKSCPSYTECKKRRNILACQWTK